MNGNAGRTGRTVTGFGGRAGRIALALVAAAFAMPAELSAQEAATRTMAGTPSAAEAEEAAVAVITELFDAMRASDAETMRGLFAEELEAFSRSSVDGAGNPSISFAEVDEFLASVAGAEPGSLDEQWRVRDVIVDDNLVTVVTPYSFAYRGSFSHCGVNVFLIAREGEDWKIIGLSDTMRQQGCEGWLDE